VSAGGTLVTATSDRIKFIPPNCLKIKNKKHKFSINDKKWPDIKSLE
jgi:hypothetical protein